MGDFQEQLRLNYPDYPIHEAAFQHDLLAHILGGGLLTPKGEVFGGLMAFLLSKNQTTPYTPYSFDGVLNRKPHITFPSLDETKKICRLFEDYYLVQNRLTPEEQLSDSAIKEIYDYGHGLLSFLIRQWGVEKGKNILGLKGYKSEEPIPASIKKRTLNKVG